MRLAGVTVAVAALVGSGMTAAPAYADTSATPLVAVNASDPSAMACYDPVTFVSGICVYASQDMGSGAYTGNTYPMSKTNMWFLPDGSDPTVQSNWKPRGGSSSTSPTVLNESQYQSPNSNWFVPANAKHLWAPDMTSNFLGGFVLLVPDVSNISDSVPPAVGLHTSSKIGISTSSSPFGPFTYQRTLPISGYASDPSITWPGDDVFPWLVYADGDYGTTSSYPCGQASIVRLPFEFDSLLSTPKRLTINGLPSTFNSCGNNSKPYIEGPEIYQFYNGYNGYYLVFAAKLTNQNEVIAYAWSDTVDGTYTYKGTIMQGSSTEWTNQASIVQLSNGHYLFFYHDGPSGSNRNRKLHAECLSFNADGTIQTITRSTSINTLKGCWNS